MIYWIIAAAVVLLLGGGLAAMLFVTMPIAKRVYRDILVRTSPEKWGRCCSAPENEEQLAMWNSGVEWGRENAICMSEVEITSYGLKLVGEYYDFGAKRCVLILPGRCECLMYAYYFAQTYTKTKCNVLVVDARAHGNSEGTYNSCGLWESRDALNWVRFLREQKGMDEVILHGVCVGGSACFLAAANPECPDYLSTIIAEGCFTSFRESFKRHMQYEKRPIFPVLDEIMHLIHKCAGNNVNRNTPLRCVKKCDKRVLFICGRQDLFSVPRESQRLYDSCISKDKRIKWLDKGAHSHLRINNTAEYDRAILDFIDRA